MTEDAEQQMPKPTMPKQTAPSGHEDETPLPPDSRFPSTGDLRVDRAVAELPDPAAHARQRVGDLDGVGVDQARPDEQQLRAESADAGSGTELPDPGLLDRHIADVTSVHRQLQQRLSDLSG